LLIAEILKGVVQLAKCYFSKQPPCSHLLPWLPRAANVWRRWRLLKGGGDPRVPERGGAAPAQAAWMGALSPCGWRLVWMGCL